MRGGADAAQIGWTCQERPPAINHFSTKMNAAVAGKGSVRSGRRLEDAWQTRGRQRPDAFDHGPFAQFFLKRTADPPHRTCR
jgi:hypothetical protein